MSVNQCFSQAVDAPDKESENDQSPVWQVMETNKSACIKKENLCKNLIVLAHKRGHPI